MSRYTHRLSGGGKVVYGYDYQLSEYFVEEWLPMAPGKEDDELIVYSVGSHYNTTVPHPKYPDKWDWSKDEIFDLLDSYPGVNRNHLDAITMDLPF